MNLSLLRNNSLKFQPLPTERRPWKINCQWNLQPKLLCHITAEQRGCNLYSIVSLRPHIYRMYLNALCGSSHIIYFLNCTFWLLDSWKSMFWLPNSLYTLSWRLNAEHSRVQLAWQTVHCTVHHAGSCLVIKKTRMQTKFSSFWIAFVNTFSSWINTKKFSSSLAAFVNNVSG